MEPTRGMELQCRSAEMERKLHASISTWKSLLCFDNLKKDFESWLVRSDPPRRIHRNMGNKTVTRSSMKPLQYRTRRSVGVEVWRQVRHSTLLNVALQYLEFFWSFLYLVDSRYAYLAILHYCPQILVGNRSFQI